MEWVWKYGDGFIWHKTESKEPKKNLKVQNKEIYRDLIKVEQIENYNQNK